jgi:hypothetical protein
MVLWFHSDGWVEIAALEEVWLKMQVRCGFEAGRAYAKTYGVMLFLVTSSSQRPSPTVIAVHLDPVPSPQLKPSKREWNSQSAERLESDLCQKLSMRASWIFPAARDLQEHLSYDVA